MDRSEISQELMSLANKCGNPHIAFIVGMVASVVLAEREDSFRESIIPWLKLYRENLGMRKMIRDGEKEDKTDGLVEAIKISETIH